MAMAVNHRALNVGRLVNVTINLQPKAAQRRGFGTLLILGDSDVITQGERLRTYTSLDAVAGDFGLDAPEYYGAALYFGQSPRPKKLMIGRWLGTAVPAVLKGGVLSAEEADATKWAKITDGALSLTIDGAKVDVTALSLSGVTNLNQVAEKLTAKLGGKGVVTWTGDEFVVKSATSGKSSKIGFATAGASGTDLATLMKLAEGLAITPVMGSGAEEPVAAVQVAADFSGDWYGLTLCATKTVTDEQHLAIAGFIEGASKSRLYGITTQNALALSTEMDTDIGSKLKKLGYKRSPVIFSSHNPYAACSMFGRAFSVNFSGNRTTLTLMYKQLPGVIYEQLTETQALALENKHINYYALYDNDTAILAQGIMPNGAWFDEVHGTDWLADALQNTLWNLLYQSKTKIPQTNEGTGVLVAAASKVMDEAVNNGLVAPGTWNADGFGALRRYDYLDSGYYIFMPSVDDQDQSEREARKAPLMQIAAKFAGAIHSIDVQVDMNR